MTAEPIATVVNDISAERVRAAKSDDNETTRDAALKLWRLAPPVIVDCSAILQSLVASQKEVRYYEDNPCIMPPWESAAFCYENTHGNVIIMHAFDTTEVHREEAEINNHLRAAGRRAPAWDDANAECDWDRVERIYNVFIYVGGQTHGKPIGTSGPMHCWQLAIYEDGEPADLHWVQLLPEYRMDNWDMAFATLLRSLNFLNASNVEAVEPRRQRGERRRLERLGVSVRTINVFPAGRSSRGAKRDEPLGVPLRDIRGHYAHYGQCCNHHDRKGLLFGKIEGRFWIPAHAVGSKDLGEYHHDYKLEVQCPSEQSPKSTTATTSSSAPSAGSTSIPTPKNVPTATRS